MKNTIGEHLSITLFGESHGTGIGVVIDGIPAGFKIDWNDVTDAMKKRKSIDSISTKRCESDEFEVLSGYFNNQTCGTPLTILIRNNDKKSSDYDEMRDFMRPSHADYVAHMKYCGSEDYRGGGHFSGRLTAPIVAAGNIAIQLLKQFDIKIATHIKQCHHIYDSPFSNDFDQLSNELDTLNFQEFAMLDLNKADECIKFIEETAAQGDSVGGILESCVLNLPVGLGEPFFDSLESRIAHYLFSIPALKGVSFGIGGEFANKYGSEVNDELFFDTTVKTRTNNNGGINGGISNGMPIIIESVIKPTPSIYRKQKSINMSTLESIELQIRGRHDPAIIHRARIVVDSMIALALCDLYIEYQATSSLIRKEN